MPTLSGRRKGKKVWSGDFWWAPLTILATDLLGSPPLSCFHVDRGSTGREGAQSKFPQGGYIRTPKHKSACSGLGVSSPGRKGPAVKVESRKTTLRPPHRGRLAMATGGPHATKADPLLLSKPGGCMSIVGYEIVRGPESSGDCVILRLQQANNEYVLEQ